ncbi:putative nucleoredoxin 1 [Platanthera guangdongensis]|uniref:protein-disulfide reductase n=1 Tax=Platanthera guangdongensis TaxID=2320717 RepID=A0ABR2LQY6_9ASPA
MAEEEEMETNIVEEGGDGERYDLRSLLASDDRDFLIRNNGDHVKIRDLEGKIVGLYFSASWCPPCRRFTPILAEAYNELASRNSNFEIIFISGDEDDEDFADYFAKMPWLAIPFSDEDTRGSLSTEFDVRGYPTVVIIDKNGELLTDEAVQGVRDYGAEGFPFTDEKIERLKKEEEEARLNQTITTVLVTNTRDFVLTGNFKKVPVSDLEGKIVGLYFSLSSFEACAGFTRRLVKFYNELKERGENFEIVLVSLEEDESSFMDDFEDMPWLGIPFKDKLSEKLVRYFDLEDLPTLTVIGADGKTVNVNVVELIEDYGVEAYPFTSKKLKEIKRREKKRIETQTLESLLVSGDKDFVVKNDGSKVCMHLLQTSYFKKFE